MRLRLFPKLFAAFALVAAAALVVLVLLAREQLARGFLDYVNAADRGQLQAAADRLAVDFNRHGGSWDFVHDRGYWPQLWRDEEPAPTPDAPRASRNSDPPAPRPPQARPRPPPDEDRPGPPPRNSELGAQRPGPPPAPPPRRDPYRLGISQRVTLIDAQDQRIIGPPLRADVTEQAVGFDAQAPIARLALTPLQELERTPDIAFLRSQSRSLYVGAMILLGLAAIAAWFLARQIARPVGQLTRAASRMTQGHYGLQVEIARRDEIGDLAERINHLSQTLKANQTARRRWIADISHELRTPLQIVSGELEAIADGIRTADDTSLASLREEVDRLTLLVEDLHQLSMSDVGSLTYAMAEQNLAALLQSLLEAFSERAREAGLELRGEWPQQVRVFVDANRLRQALANLLSNAIKYTDAPGTIDLHVEEGLGDVIIVIEDSAPGVSSDDLQRLGEAFFRGVRSRRDGSGLGLAICRRIADGHGGRLTFARSARGGLCARFALPKRARATGTESNHE